MKIYIAGPMTGIPDYNRPAFMKAEQDLLNRGLTPLNPAWLPPREGLAYRDYIIMTLMILLQANALTLLPGWKKSKGAFAEYHVARALGIPIYTLEELLDDI